MTETETSLVYKRQDTKEEIICIDNKYELIKIHWNLLKLPFLSYLSTKKTFYVTCRILN